MTNTDRDPEIQDAFSRLDIPAYPEDFFTNLTATLKQQSHRQITAREPRQQKRVFWTTSAAAAVVAVLVLSGVLYTQSTNSGKFHPTLASQIVTKTSGLLSTLNTVSGTVNFVDGPTMQGSTQLLPGDSFTENFRMRSDGSYWVSPTNPQDGATTAYDATTGVYEGVGYGTDPLAAGQTAANEFVQVGSAVDSTAPTLPGSTAPSTALQAYRISGAFGTAPDAQFGTDVAFLSGIATAVQTLRNSPTAANFEGTTFDGAPAWHVSLPDSTISPDFHDKIDLTVDQKSLFPVQVHEQQTFNYGGADVVSATDTTVHNLSVNPKFDSHDFRVSFPAGVKVDNNDFHAKVTTPNNAKSIVGYTPAKPIWLPQGFKLSTTVAAKGTEGTGGMDTGGNIIDDSDVVASTYTQGANRIVITTRSAGPEGTTWSDPLSLGDDGITDNSIPAPTTDVTLASGLFSGAKAHVVAIPYLSLQPHMWGQSSKFVFTIEGNLTNSDFARIANSLR